MHPLCQAAPIKVLKAMQRRDTEGAASGARYLPRKIPFATVVTDLATPHPFWLHSGADLCFVPSRSFERAAKLRGFESSQLRLHGLPVRPAFAESLRNSGREQKAELAETLGLLPNRKTVLVVGGGDGVGNLGAIVEALGERMAERNAATGGESAPQLVVICGKNHKLRQQLRERSWGPHLHVVIEGFTTRMSDYMSTADTIVTKAGPGTIAEACCCGLPIMLSGHLPGQESGNVDFVVDGGFGSYSSDPKVIASTVTGWLEDDAKLKDMSERSLRASRPDATQKIADDIVALVNGKDAHAHWHAAAPTQSTSGAASGPISRAEAKAARTAAKAAKTAAKAAEARARARARARSTTGRMPAAALST